MKNIIKSIALAGCLIGLTSLEAHGVQATAPISADNGVITCTTCTTSASPTNYGVAVGGASQALGFVGPDSSSTKFLRSNGSSANPSFESITAGNISGTMSLASGGTGVSLSDPNADRILFWDDGEGAVAFLADGSGISISATTLNIDLLSSQLDTGSTTSSYSGFEFAGSSSQLSLLQGCGDGEILKWEEDDDTWKCASDNNSGGGGGGGGGSLSEEEVEDYVGGMLGGTETGITVTYQDSTNDIDFVVSDLTVAGDSGSTAMTPGDTLTVAGSGSVSTAMSGDTLTITGLTYSAGDGLDLSTTTFSTDLKSGSGLVITSTELDIDTDVIQARVSSSCSAGSSIRAIAANGTVTCETDDSGGGGGGASDLTDLGDVNISSIGDKQILIYDNADSRFENKALSGDITITAAGVASVAANAVALTTDTTGDYVASATSNGGLALTGSEGGSLGIAYSNVPDDTNDGATGDSIMVLDTSDSNALKRITLAELDTLIDTDTNTQLTEEQVEDFVGGMLGGTETGISVTYNDGDNDIDFVVADLTVAGDSGSTAMTPGDTLTVAGAGTVSTAMSGDTLTVTGSAHTTDTKRLTTFVLTADSGVNQTLAHGDALDIAGGTNATTVVGATDTVTINVDDAFLKNDAADVLDVETSATNSVTDVLTLQSQSSGTPANNIGVGVALGIETAAGNVETGARIAAVATDVDPTNEDVDLVFYTMLSGDTANEALRVHDDGTVTAATFVGALTGNVTGNVSGSSGSTTGNAGTASALAANPTDCGSNQFANAIAADGDLTCGAIGDADVPNTITVDLATAATALASNPTDCGSNQFATTIAASGNLTCAAISDADVPNTITASNYLPLAGGTLTGALAVQVDTDTELVAATLTNLNDEGSDDIVSVLFNLEDSGGTLVDSGKVAVKKTTTMTGTASTQDTSMVFSTSVDGTLTERMTIASDGTINATTFVGALTGEAQTAAALAANPTDCSSNQFANAIAANGNLTCAAIADADVPNTITVNLAAAATALETARNIGGVSFDGTGNINLPGVNTAGNQNTSGNADTASALAANPTDCSSNQFANAIAADGDLTCAAIADGDVPDTITASNYLPLAGGTLTANIKIDVASGDPAIVFDTDGADKFTVGVDDSESDKFKIDSGGSLVDAGDFELDSSGNLAIAGDLTIGGDDLVMATNDDTYILVADDTSFNPVAMSGDVAIANNGATTIQADSVALTTDTTGNYVATITAGTGLTSTGGTSGEGVAHSLSVDAAQSGITSVGTLTGLTVSNDVTIRDAVNDGNPVLALGAAAAEQLTITSVYDSGGQTLDYVELATATADTGADEGRIIFDVDGSDIVTIDDGGLSLSASLGLDVDGTAILSDSSGTMTLSNVDALGATTEGTIESAIDTLANLTSFGAVGATTNIVAGDVTMYNAVNGGDPSISLGSDAAERLSIVATYDSSAQTLASVEFATAAASGTADKGKMIFDVDGADIVTIDDGGLSLSASLGLDVNGTAILSDSSGTMTLDNIDALGSTTESTIETAIDTLANLTSFGAADATTNIVAGDVTMYNDANDGNPTISLGSSSAERLLITANYASGAKTVDSIEFATAVASGTADKGKIIFDIDGTDIATIDDGGIDLASGKSFTVNGSSIAGASLTGNTDNTIVTVTGTDAIAGEANLTFDGSDLSVATTNSKVIVKSTGTSNNTSEIQILADNDADAKDGWAIKNNADGTLQFNNDANSAGTFDHTILTLTGHNTEASSSVTVAGQLTTGCTAGSGDCGLTLTENTAAISNPSNGVTLAAYGGTLYKLSDTAEDHFVPSTNSPGGALLGVQVYRLTADQEGEDDAEVDLSWTRQDGTTGIGIPLKGGSSYQISGRWVGTKDNGGQNPMLELYASSGSTTGWGVLVSASCADVDGKSDLMVFSALGTTEAECDLAVSGSENYIIDFDGLIFHGSSTPADIDISFKFSSSHSTHGATILVNSYLFIREIPNKIFDN